jgi:hypothetical protein
VIGKDGLEAGHEHMHTTETKGSPQSQGGHDESGTAVIPKMYAVSADWHVPASPRRNAGSAPQQQFLPHVSNPYHHSINYQPNLVADPLHLPMVLALQKQNQTANPNSPFGPTQFQRHVMISPRPPSIEVSSGATAPIGYFPTENGLHVTPIIPAFDHLQQKGFVSANLLPLEDASVDITPHPSSSSSSVDGSHVSQVGDIPIQMKPVPLPPSSEPPQFVRHVMSAPTTSAVAALPCPSSIARPPMSQPAFNPCEDHSTRDFSSDQQHIMQFSASQQQDFLAPRLLLFPQADGFDAHLEELMALQKGHQSESSDYLHHTQLITLKQHLDTTPPFLSSNACHFPRHEPEPPAPFDADCNAPSLPTPKRSTEFPSKYRQLWLDKNTRNYFLYFCIFFIVWVALDILFDILFGIETFRITPSGIPSSSPLRHFFPAAFVFLVISFLITTSTNACVYRRVVLMSSSEHKLESKGETRLVWEELFQYVSIIFQTILIVSVGSACKSMVRRMIGIYKWFFVVGSPTTLPIFPHSPTMLSTFVVVGPMNLAKSFAHLPKTIPVALRSIFSLCSLAMTGKWKQCDVLDSETMFPHFVSYLNQRVVQSCFGGVSVEFCNSEASSNSDDGYLVFWSSYVVRPVASLFNLKTRINPDANMNVIDPLDSGYFERVTRWWGNYEAWQESPTMSFIMFIPFLSLAITLPLLQIVASLLVAVFHMTAMIIQLLFLPVLFPLGYASGVLFSFWNSVKYLTGAICIFSPKMPSLRFQMGTTDLNRYSSYCRGICSLHALHASAFQVGDVPYRFKIAFMMFGIIFYPVRAVMLTLTSFVLCALCWIAAFMFQLCLGLFQICAFFLAIACGTFSFFFLLVTTVAYILISPFMFLLALALLIAWFLISVFALLGMELLCLLSAMTNPEAGLILYDNVTELRFKLAAVAGLFEDFPCLILQAYYTAIVGTRGTAGKCRMISLALSSWRMCVLTGIRVFKMRKFAIEKKGLSATPSKSWEIEKQSLSSSHAVTRNIMFNFRSSLFPDRFSAFLRIFVFGIYAAFFGWLGSQNLYTSNGSIDFMDSHFPIPVVCGSPQYFTVCDVNARCEGDICVCNTGYGGNGQQCIRSRPGTCNPVITQCAYAAMCQDTPGGFTCSCPSWTTAPIGGSAFYGSGNISSDICACDTLSFPNLNIDKGACVTTLNLTQGEVAAIMLFVGYIPVILLCLAHWKWVTRGGSAYPKHWKWIFTCLLLTLVSVSLGLYLGGITSMMVLVVCIPIVLVFIAHFKWLTRDGSKYPIKWKIAFVIIFITVLCLSLGLMFGNVLASNVEKYRNQAAIMIFAVCFPIILMFLLYWQYTTRGGAKPLNEKTRRRRKIILVAIFIAIFALSLGLILGLSSQPRIDAFVITASDRKAGKMAAAVTLSFTPVNSIPSGGTITLNYPTAFFAADVTPVLPVGSSSVGSLTGTCGATTATSLVITTAGATIPASTFTVTIVGFTMGSLTDGAVDVTLQTSADTLVSLAIASGGIFPPISEVGFKIPSTDRVSGKSNVPLTLEFTPANPIPPGGKITINYPPAFFLSSITPSIAAGTSSVAGLTGSCSSTNLTSLVITTSGVTVPAAAFSVTIAGFTLGPVTKGAVSVKIETSADILPSLDVFSGGIYTQVTMMTMTIGSAERIARRPAVYVTFSFTPTNGIPIGGSITLHYPTDFFAASVTPTLSAGKSNIASLTGACSATTATSLVITTAGATIPASAAFTVTISGLTMGSVTAGSVGITIQTSTDTLPSAASQSGPIDGQVNSVIFGIASSHRIAGKASAVVTLSFTTSTSISSGGTIALTYPSAFFAPSITPTAAAGSSSIAGLTCTCSATTATSIVITTAGAIIPASSFTVTISGLIMGAVTAGAIAVSVHTSTDILPSLAVDSGNIVGGTVSFVTSPSFYVASSDRIAGKSPVSITIGFTPTTLLSIGETITIRYPAAFFAASFTPTLAAGASSIPALTATCGATTATSFVITTAGAVIPATAFTITISGFKMGAVTPGAAAVTVETSTDIVPSAACSSGLILGQLAAVSFSISLHHRIVGKTSVPLTLSFTSSTVLPPGGTLTLTYPSAFFAQSITPSLAAGSSSVAGLIATCGITTATSVVITTAGAAIPASAVTFTVTGFTMGGATTGAFSYLESSADTLISLPVASGAIVGQVDAVTFLLTSSDRIAAKTNIPVTLGFTPSTSLNPGGTITLTYPSAFFATTTPTVLSGKSNIASLTGACSATTATSLVITTAGATIPASAAFTVTISGLTMGSVTAGGVGITVETSADTLPSAAVSSGGIFTQVTFVSFSISSSDRISGKSAVPITFGFSATTPVPINGTITLGYPTAFFTSGVTPSAILAGATSIAALTGTCGITTTTYVVITTAAAIIPSSAVVVTVNGFTLGAVTPGAVGITVSTSADTAASVAISSGAIFGQVTTVAFTIQPTDRIAARASVPVTVSFTLTTALPIGGTITLNYPSGFFAPSITPSPISAGTSNLAGLTGTCAATTATSVVMTTATAAIPAANFVVTISGFQMGPVTAGAVGITVQTSSDTEFSPPVASGAINGQVTAISFTVASSDRIAAKAAVPVTLAFTLTTLLPIAGTITLSFPQSFFAASTPTVSAGSSTVAGFSGTCSATNANSVILTTGGAAIPASPFVVTISGFVMGAATAGAVSVTVQTSADTAISDSVASGGIYTQVTAVSFVIAAFDRIAFRTSVPVTVGFTPTTAVPIGSTITVTYPAAFFSPSVTPSAITSNVVALTGTCGATASTSIVMTTAGTIIPALAPFVVTIRYDTFRVYGSLDVLRSHLSEFVFQLGFQIISQLMCILLFLTHYISVA